MHSRLAAIAIQVSSVANGAIRPVRLPLMSVTVATIVVAGVTKRNHSVKSSAKFSGNQCGMRRSIGNARMNAKNPNNAGKHHQNENQLLPCGGRVSSRFVTNSSTSNNYNRLSGGGWGVLSIVGFLRFDNSNYRSGSLVTASRRPTSSSNFAAGCPGSALWYLGLGCSASA
jgi:hypothetical protein